ncbi:unnamed protein product [Dibothriocephalus latus]|uniref:Phosphatidylinositol transfer protein N-terminal domain-containing protein n=1 Tax=Dibothriocephalus latus TaxID=60516 RepID=A0A3P7LKZ8_DIBLA|nr:unnamed protein product [Dibothriocephalus latus]
MRTDPGITENVRLCMDIIQPIQLHAPALLEVLLTNFMFGLFSAAGWLRSIIPKTALKVEEEAWNAYPYIKTRYYVPFMEKFRLELETKYLGDGGDRDDVFELPRNGKLFTLCLAAFHATALSAQ